MPLYAGMTVNERLVISGQMTAWDEAVSRSDRAKMIETLMATELTAEQAAYTTDTTLANPEKYGFPPAKGCGGPEPRHCERSEAIQSLRYGRFLDRFVASLLAMTVKLVARTNLTAASCRKP